MKVNVDAFRFSRQVRRCWTAIVPLDGRRRPQLHLEIDVRGVRDGARVRPTRFWARLYSGGCTHAMLEGARCVSLRDAARKVAAVDLAPHIAQLDRFQADVERQ